MDANDTTLPPESQGRRGEFLIGSVDQVRAIIRACPSARTMTAYCMELKASLVMAMNCKRWGCRVCGEQKARHLGFKVEDAEPNRLITLTVNPQYYENPRQAYDDTRRKIADLSKAVRKRRGEFEYLRVLEVTKKGWPHYHLVARCPFIAQGELSSLWGGMTGAPIVDIRAIRSKDNVYQYVVKYLCKQHYVPWTERRISWSKKFFRKEPTDDHVPWQIELIQHYKEHPSEFISEHYRDQEMVAVTPTAWMVAIT